MASIDRIAKAINGSGGAPTIYYGTYVAPEGVDANLHHITILSETFHFIPSSMSLIWKMQTVYFTNSGTFTKANYKNLLFVEAQVIGGGGAGGGASATGASQWSFGDGGGAGEYARGRILASALSASETVTIGAGGVGGTGAGGDGGTTSLGAHITAVGGGGGSVRPATVGLNFSADHSAKAGGTGGTGGDFRTRGSAGGTGVGITAPTGTGQRGGDGAPSQFGGGGVGGANATGGAGEGYGAGGGGAARGQSLGALNGANGAKGGVILDLYGGPAVGSTVVLLKSDLVPLTIIGVLAGDNTLATV